MTKKLKCQTCVAITAHTQVEPGIWECRCCWTEREHTPKHTSKRSQENKKRNALIQDLLKEKE